MIYYVCDLCKGKQSSPIDAKPSKDNPLGEKLRTIRTYSELRKIDNTLEHVCIPCDQKVKKIYEEERAKSLVNIQIALRKLIDKTAK